jgi:hypothetical protein
LHPGLVDTGIWESAPAVFRWPLKLACSEEVEGVTGKYFSEEKVHFNLDGAWTSPL